MTKRNFLLVIEPGLVIGPTTSVQNPLLEALIAPRQIFRERITFRISCVPSQVGNASDDTAAPVLDDVFYLSTQNFASQPEITLIFFPEPDAVFKFMQLLQ